MILVAVLMLAAIAGLIGQIGNSNESLPSEIPEGIPAEIAYTTHDPIIIDGNAGFMGPNGTTGITKGSGTESDPYIIEGWDINASTANGIEIQNTDAHFIVRNCHVHDGQLNRPYSDGIHLYVCANGTLDGNTCSNNEDAIYLDSSSNNTLISNTCSNNIDGTYFNSSSNNVLNNNNFSSNSYGMFLTYSSGNILVNNTCISNGLYGISLWDSSNNNNICNNNCSNNYGGITVGGDQCNHNIISNNNCSNNDKGIELASSSDNHVSSNNCSGIRHYGIFLQLSSSNALKNNTCSNSEYGIYLTSSSGNNMLVDNNCSHNSQDGMLVESSSNNTLSNNNCSSNDADGMFLGPWSNNNTLVSNRGFWNANNGIGVVSSSNNTLVSNHWSSNGYDGAYIGYSTNNTLDSNNCSSNNRWGIQIRNSSGNVMLRNQLCDNLQYGMHIYDASSSNIVFNNTFIGNNGAGSVYDAGHVQAYDDGANNWWNSTSGYGNWWGDWTFTDGDMDGIVDSPYEIDGYAGARDCYPRTNVTSGETVNIYYVSSTSDQCWSGADSSNIDDDGYIVPPSNATWASAKATTWQRDMSMLSPPDAVTTLQSYPAANWIWKDYQVTLSDSVTGDIVFFKKRIMIPNNATGITANLETTADNAYYFYVNNPSWSGIGNVSGLAEFADPTNFYYISDGVNDLSGGDDSTPHEIVNHVYPLKSAIPDILSPNGWGDVESWSVSGLHAGENWLQIVSMNAHSPPSGSMNPAGLAYKLKISYHVPTEVAIHLLQGWNLVSVPLTSHGYYSSTLGLQTGDVVAGWDSATQAYDKFYIVGAPLRLPRLPRFMDFVIEPNTGYLIYAVGEETVDIHGVIPVGTQSRLITVPTSGWAMIGFNATRHASDIPAMYGGGEITKVASYDPTTRAYKSYIPAAPQTDYMLEPGEGYWVFCTASGTLSYNP